MGEYFGPKRIEDMDTAEILARLDLRAEQRRQQSALKLRRRIGQAGLGFDRDENEEAGKKGGQPHPDEQSE